MLKTFRATLFFKQKLSGWTSTEQVPDKLGLSMFTIFGPHPPTYQFLYMNLIFPQNDSYLFFPILGLD